VWKDLKIEKELVVTNNGKPIALLTPVAEGNLEETLHSIRKARASEAITSMRKLSSRKGNQSLPMDEIDREIRKHRKGE